MHPHHHVTHITMSPASPWHLHHHGTHITMSPTSPCHPHHHVTHPCPTSSHHRAGAGICPWRSRMYQLPLSCNLSMLPLSPHHPTLSRRPLPHHRAVAGIFQWPTLVPPLHSPLLIVLPYRPITPPLPHCLPLPPTASHCLPLPPTPSHCLPLPPTGMGHVPTRGNTVDVTMPAAGDSVLARLHAC
ncbi:unnamed protein product [Closterium sp. NIES-54]